MADETKPTTCCHATPRFGVGAKQCNNAAKVNRDGKPYCGIHDPVKAEERYTEKIARWHREAVAKAAERKRQADREELERLAGLPSLTDDELRAIIAAGGVQSLLGAADGRGVRR